MRLNWNFPGLAMFVVLALFGAGCSGINTGTSVSPMDFLLPGLGHLIKADPEPTNSPSSFPEISKEFALTK